MDRKALASTTFVLIGFIVAVLLLLAVVSGIFPGISEGLGFTKVIIPPEEGCKPRAYYSQFIKTSYEEGDLQKGTELFMDFNDCYPGEEPDIPREVKIFFSGREAAALSRNQYTSAALDRYWELLAKYPDDLVLMQDTVRSINELYDEIIKSAKKTYPGNRTIVIQNTQRKIEHLKAIYLNFINRGDHKVPLDLVLIYIGDSYAQSLSFDHAVEYYKKAMEDYPVRNDTTGQGRFAPDAQSRIMDIAKAYTGEGKYDKAAELTYWLYKNHVTYTHLEYVPELMKGVVRTPEYWEGLTKGYIIAIGERIQDAGGCKDVTFCSDYKEYYCDFDICDVGPCEYVSGVAFEGCVEKTAAEIEEEEEEAPATTSPVCACRDYKTQEECESEECRQYCVWEDDKCDFTLKTELVTEP